MSTRRDFIRQAATGTVVLAAHENVFAQQTSPNDKIQVGLIGLGIRGSETMPVALRVPGVELVAVADVYEGRLTRAKELWGPQIVTTRDYRELLARPEIDAVIIATPDHWHSRMSIDAMAAGKDVYCEKPVVQQVEEGGAVIDSAKKHSRILQVGSQRVSSLVYQKARDLFRSGAIGTLNMIEAWIDRNSAMGAWQYTIPPDASPQTIDWDRFIGHAPKRPFEPVRLFRWRNYRDYGTGVAGDLFVHLFTGIHFVISSNGPNRVMTSGGLRFWKDGRDVPDVMIGIFDYPETPNHPAFNLLLKVNFADGGGEGTEFRFIGNEGMMTIGGGGVSLTKRQPEREPGMTIESFPEAIQKQYLEEYRKKYPSRKGTDRMQSTALETYSVGRNYNDTFDHFATFFASVRSRQPVLEDAVFGLRAAGPALLGNLSYFNKRPYLWNPDTMRLSEA
jgi:predicted dehydrogenase